MTFSPFGFCIWLWMLNVSSYWHLSKWKHKKQVQSFFHQKPKNSIILYWKKIGRERKNNENAICFFRKKSPDYKWKCSREKLSFEPFFFTILFFTFFICSIVVFNKTLNGTFCKKLVRLNLCYVLSKHLLFNDESRWKVIKLEFDWKWNGFKCIHCILALENI